MFWYRAHVASTCVIRVDRFAAAMPEEKSRNKSASRELQETRMRRVWLPHRYPTDPDRSQPRLFRQTPTASLEHSHNTPGGKPYSRLHGSPRVATIADS